MHRKGGGGTRTDGDPEKRHGNNVEGQKTSLDTIRHDFDHMQLGKKHQNPSSTVRQRSN